MRAALASIFLMVISAPAAAVQTSPPDNDPYLWLEDVSGPKAMAWVDSHNARSKAILEADPRYQQYYNEALEIAQAKDRIPYASFRGGQVYNFWQDADHVRGIWRRASLESYASGSPQWETVLDLDALSTAEKANWVWKGAQCARPLEQRCLISLSDGGGQGLPPAQPLGDVRIAGTAELPWLPLARDQDAVLILPTHALLALG